MTRLRSEDIRDFMGDLDGFDGHLRAVTGCSLLEIGCLVAGSEPQDAAPLTARNSVLCVPMTCGEGRIEGFAECLAGIAQHLGFPAGVTDFTDAAGWAEAIEAGADIILSADDLRFVAVHTRTRIVSENGEATGRGFAVGLDRLAGGVRKKPVLVIGCGPVGQNACRKLLEMGASLSLFDINRNRSIRFARLVAAQSGKRVSIEPSLTKALHSHRFVVDASPAADIIDETQIAKGMVVSAPGVPCGVTARGRQLSAARVLHDPLSIGVATMLMEVLANLTRQNMEKTAWMDFSVES